MNEFPGARLHIDQNHRTRDDWDSYAEHRQNVSRVIQVGLDGASETGKSLGILGAGNGNDIDLESLSRQFAEISLIDLDRDAVEYCLSRLPDAANITVLAPLDVSGILAKLSAIDSFTDEQFDDLVAAARDVSLPELAPLDVVVSTCLLSQLIDSVNRAFADHPRLLELVLAVRDAHLNLLSQLTKPGGTSILITDFVSSDTFAQLANIDAYQLPQAIKQALASQNFFTGLNPAVLVQKMSPENDATIVSAQVHPPWRWQMGPRCFAVFAIEAHRV